MNNLEHTVAENKAIENQLTEFLSTTILPTLPDGARVWVYQSSRSFSEKETAVLTSQLGAFVSDWTAHSQQLTAGAAVVLGRFVILAVDEQQAAASGCSIDKSVKFLQEIENQFQIALFDRLSFAFWQNNTVQTVSVEEFKNLFAQGIITSETYVFDNLVATIAQLKSAWLKPLSESWHKRFAS
jgi:hypothetical protein